MTTVDQLTMRQRLFVGYYLGECRLNATAAAAKAGYAHANVRGPELRKHPVIQAAIDAKLDEVGLTADEIIAGYAEEATATIGDVLDAKGRFSLAQARKNGRIACVRKMQFDEHGKIKSIEMYSRHDARDKLARIRRMYADEVRVGVQVDVDVITEAQKIREARRARGKS